MFRPGLDQEAMEWRRAINIPERARVVLSPRAFRRLYGHDVIVRAFARATADGHDDTYLVFKAYDCWHRDYVDRITALAASCGIQDRIRIVDEVAYERLPVFYGLGDLAINFPAMDAFPVTFLESLACEVPVLTKHLPAYDSLGVSPYLRFTEAPTEEALQKGINAMLSLPPSRREMARARAYVAANFDESVIANSLGQAYRRTLDAHSKTGRSSHFTGVKQVIWTAIYRMLDFSA
jgi:glycosyltransferase involved in cell wall biosynthesis